MYKLKKEKHLHVAAQHLTSWQNQCCQLLYSDLRIGMALVLPANRYQQAK